jgi:hypothetical protein
MKHSVVETLTHYFELDRLQPSLVLLNSVNGDEVCADILPRSG